jgi:hypothetical protein
MIRALNNVQTANDYTTANTLRAHGAVRFDLFVSAVGSVFLQLGIGDAPEWEQEALYAPGAYGEALAFDWARVRSAAPGVPVQVNLKAVTR